MAAVVPQYMKTGSFTDANLWTLGDEEHWGKLKEFLAPITDKNFAVTSLQHRLVIEDIGRRFDSSKTRTGSTIVHTMMTNETAASTKWPSSRS
jgi:hypothetical protein